MKTMEERLLISRAKDLDIDISNGWRQELTFLEIIKLYSYGKDKEAIKIFKEGLEEATLNKEIEARKEAFHKFCLVSGAGWQQYKVDAETFKGIECDHKLNEMSKMRGVDLPYWSQLIISSAVMRLNQEPIKTNHPTNFLGTPTNNVIILDWYYTPEALSLWFKCFGCEPGDLLNAWFSAAGISLDPIVGNEESKPNKKLSVDEFFPNLPKERTPSFRARLIKEAVQAFMIDHKRYPTDFCEIWDKLKIKYKDHVIKVKGEETISVNGNNLGKDSCRKGFSNYKRPNCPKVDIKDYLDNL